MRNNMDFGKIPSGFYNDAPDGGKKISRILLGTASAPYANGAEQNALLDEMFASGITAYDTARVYGGAEECLGNWIASRKNRDKVWIETKCGHPDASGHKRVNEQAMRRDLETSLAALKTDYVDALLLHRDDEDVPVSEITEIFNMFYREGKVRAFGVSNWNYLRFSEANDYAAAHGLRPFTFSSPCFSLADMVGDPWGGCVSLSGEKNAAARGWYKQSRIPVIAYASLARGLFSGKVSDAESAAACMDAVGLCAYGCEANYARAKRCAALAQEKGMTAAQVALAWIFRQGLNVFAVIGTSNPARMRENIAAFSLALTKDECDWLNGR